MAKKVFWSVREAGERIIRHANQFKPQYPENFLRIIPRYLFENIITNENQERLASIVWCCEFYRIGYLAAVLGVPVLEDSNLFKLGGPSCVLQQTINHPHPEDLPEQRRELVREIKFLFDLRTHIALLGKSRSRVEFLGEGKKMWA
ncbi:MAG: hypothetical protein A2359_04395 [Candidatus Moranbacteria bacterium RIFOXYB1_FULL_43_19]|nr:MAG: hypothetical protein A2359_04395 [Candidatus Moranbacteria bacterium RIFOXYB1_FULL_43_19]OGI33117.1 MAG: hypothetical protein A2420_05635 [Candidatus Moranbacteria bacterium RIFOXYC1_FULL_44_13]